MRDLFGNMAYLMSWILTKKAAGVQTRALANVCPASPGI